MGGTVTDDELFERARAVAQHQLSEQEAREGLTEEETVQFLRYLSNFRSIGWAVKAYRANQLNLRLIDAIGHVLPSDEAAKAKLTLISKQYQIKHDFTNDIEQLVSENRARIGLAMRGRYSRQSDPVYQADMRNARIMDRLFSETSGKETRFAEYKIELTGLALETLSQTSNEVRAYRAATVISFIQDVVDSLQV